MNLRKTLVLMGLLLGLSGPAMAEVFVEGFDDPLGDWTSGWLYLNSNMENYYTAVGNCDPNDRGNNPSGLWISDDRGCGTFNSVSPVVINILNGFGDAATEFSIDACRFGGDLTLSVYDKDGVLDQTTPVTGGCTFPFVNTTYPFILNNGMSRFELSGTSIEGNTTVDNVTINTDAVVDVPDRATFYVTKDFTDDNPMPVEVTLACNTGLPLVQTFMISDPGTPYMVPFQKGGDTMAYAGLEPSASSSVTFVVTNFEDGAMDCTVTESPVANYTPSYDDGTISDINCSYDAVVSGAYSCAITNTPDPATFIVNKVWEVSEEGGGDDVDRVADITITCDAEIEGGYQDDDDFNSEDGPTGIPMPPGYGDWMLDGTIIGDGSLEATVDTSMGPATCWAEEDQEQSGVDSTDDCDPREIGAGETSECTITNTVFFEGIPSLNQYGLAIMALLMLGMGMVGFRRFA